jgi:hypothetical protein
MGTVKRKKYKPQAEGKLATSAPMAQMRAIAFNPQPARRTLNRLDRMHDDDAAEAAAKAKRERKLAKRAKEVTK